MNDPGLRESGEPEQPDIVREVLLRVVALRPDFSAEEQQQIEREVKARFGGLRIRIPKRRKHLTADEREAVFKDGLANQPNDEILTKYRISLRTLERQMKRGGRF